MGHWVALVARLTTAGLLAAGMSAMPSPNAETAVARSSGCPPATIQRLVGEGPFTCYGSRVLTFLAYVQHPCTDGCGGTSATVMSPHWLDGGEGSLVFLSASPSGATTAAFAPPALGRCSPFADLRSCPFHQYQGQWATVRARFNDPISRMCHYSEHPPGAEFSRKAAVAECRADLVALSVSPAAPETDVAGDVVADPARRPARPPWAILFIVALVLAARWAPSRRTAEGGPDQFSEK